MLGKEKCRILKEIRRKIADENDIPFVTKECTYQGECKGTCPRCESELRYLEKQLAQRTALGRRITVVALCAGIAVAGAGCSQANASSPVEEDVMELSGEVDYNYGSEDYSDYGETGSGAAAAASTRAAADAGTSGDTAASAIDSGTVGCTSASSDENDKAEAGSSGRTAVEIDDTELTGLVPDYPD